MQFFHKLILFAFLLCLTSAIFTASPSTIHAASYTAVQDGNWDAPATWGGTIPTADDEVTIPNGITVTIPAITVTRDAPTMQNGTLINNGSFTNNHTFANTGSFTNTYSGGFLGASGSVFNNLATGSILNNGGFDNYGTLHNPATATIYNSIAGYMINHATLENNGLFTDHSGFTTSPTGTSTNSGTLDGGDSGGLHINGTFINTGTITIGYAGSVNITGTFNNEGTFTNSSFMFSVVNNGTLNNSGSFVNGYTFDNYHQINNGGSITNNAMFINHCGGVITGNAVSGNPVVNEFVAVAPTLGSPAHRTHTTNTTPSFSWGNVVGAESYRLMIYVEDRSFNYKQRTFSASYTLAAAEALTHPNKYLWRIRTQDAACSTWTGWSGRNTLFVD